MIEIKESKNSSLPNIMVMGIGGAGSNAVNRMIDSGTKNVTFVAVNTDIQALEDNKAPIHIQIGKKLTGGYGAGADPAIGEASAREDLEEIERYLDNFQMVILACGMGGGTGTGAIPVIAEACKSRGILTVAVVTTPFFFEGSSRPEVSERGLIELKKHIDTLLIISNDKLLTVNEKVFYLEDAFRLADSVLEHTISGITNIIYNKGIINLDFNDIRTTLTDKGVGHLGVGIAGKEGSVMDAIMDAINSPLLETTIEGASNILINSSGHINLLDLNKAMNAVREMVGGKINLIWGTVNPKEPTDEIVVTLIATGMKDKEEKRKSEIVTESSAIYKAMEDKSLKKEAPALAKFVVPTFLQVK